MTPLNHHTSHPQDYRGGYTKRGEGGLIKGKNHNMFAVGGHLHPTHCPGVPVSRCPSVLASRCPRVPVCRIPVSQCPGVPVFWCPSVPVSRCPSVPVSHCPSVPMSWYLGVPVSRCPSVLVSQCPSNLWGTTKHTGKGGTEKRTIFGTDRRTDRQTEVHIEVVPT